MFSFFFEWAKPGLFYFIFVLFTMHRQNGTNLTVNYLSIDGVGLVLEPSAAGCKAQMTPLSYGGLVQYSVTITEIDGVQLATFHEVRKLDFQ